MCETCVRHLMCVQKEMKRDRDRDRERDRERQRKREIVEGVRERGGGERRVYEKVQRDSEEGREGVREGGREGGREEEDTASLASCAFCHICAYSL